jgi:tetratricopeptide (TPR) repeat protein
VDAGVEALQKSLAIAPGEARANIQFSLGSAYFQKKDYRAAIAELEAGLKVKPDSAPALFDLGNAYLKLERFPESIAAFEKAIGQDKKFWPAINNIGLVKYEQGDIDAALQRWRSVLKMDEKQAEPKLAVAIALYKRGKVEEALSLAQGALSADPRYSRLSFLEDNLWGKKLLQDTAAFFETPRMQDFLSRLPVPPANARDTEEE